MKKVTFNCTVTTPMFISGADQLNYELRVPSFKGALRFWWRAMNGDLKADELHSREAQFFGGSGQEHGKSKVILRLNNVELDHMKSGDLRKNITQLKGISYLFFSVLDPQDRKSIKENSTFSLTFLSKDEKYLEESVKAFGLLVNFGGIGSRNRRGAGSFAVKSMESIPGGYEYLFNLSEIKNVAQLTEHFEKIGKELRGMADCPYPILKNSKVYIFNPEKDWRSALNKLGSPYLEFRKQEKERVFETPYFGFPVNKDSTVFMANHADQLIERKPSPLIFKVLKTSDECFFPVIIRLSGLILPNGHKIIESRNGNQVRESREINSTSETNQIIEDYFTFLRIKENITL